MVSPVPTNFQTPISPNIVLRGYGVSGNGQPCGEDFLLTTGQIAMLASNFSNDSPTNVTAAIGTTLTAAALLSGLINRTGPTANFTDTTDTATNIVAASAIGSSFYVDIKNATAFNQTLTGGVNVTFSSSNVIPGNSIAEFLVQVVSATSVIFNHVFTTAIADPVLKVATVLNTVGAGTITGAGIAGTITSRQGAQSATAFTDTTDIAANIIAAQLNAHIGDSWYWIYQNTTNAPATIQGGTGVTVSVVTVVPANSSAQYLVTYTAAATITMAGLGVTNSPVNGTFTANGATTVTVANAAFSPGSQVLITLKTVGGTVGALPHLLTATPGTGFTVSGTASDTSVYNYSILG